MDGAVAQLVEQRTENPCVGGSIPPHTTKPRQKRRGFYFMYSVYILYSKSGAKTYVGYTNDIVRRISEHNVTESTGFTLRYRPWILVRTEDYQTKSEAMVREKPLETQLSIYRLIVPNNIESNFLYSQAWLQSIWK